MIDYRNGRRLIVSEIDRRERYYNDIRPRGSSREIIETKLLIRSRKIIRDCAESFDITDYRHLATEALQNRQKRVINEPLEILLRFISYIII